MKQKETRDELIQRVVGVTREQIETFKEVCYITESKADLVKSLNPEHHKPSETELKMHLVNTMNAMAAFGYSGRCLFESVIETLCKQLIEPNNED